MEQPVIAAYSGQAEDGWIVWCKSLFCSCVPPATQQGNTGPPQPWTGFRNTFCLLASLFLSVCLVMFTLKRLKTQIVFLMVKDNRQIATHWQQGCIYSGRLEKECRGFQRDILWRPNGFRYEVGFQCHDDGISDGFFLVTGWNERLKQTCCHCLFTAWYHIHLSYCKHLAKIVQAFVCNVFVQRTRGN